MSWVRGRGAVWFCGEWPRQKFRERSNRRVSIPGADVLANITAEDHAADPGAQVFRNRAAQLDRDVRDAAAGIEQVRLGDRLSRARIEAKTALAAEIRR